MMTERNFDDFTYSKKKHFQFFREKEYDKILFGECVNPENCDLKIYQDLFMFAFIKENVNSGSKILDVGGGDSRILKYFKDEYECWNIDKLEGIGHGPTEIDSGGIHLVVDYMGEFNKELPDNYFDLVFSISTLEHVTIGDTEMYANILSDINRVLKHGGDSVHCVDHTTDLLLGIEEEVWVNPVIPFFFNNQKMINKFVPLEKAESDPELYHMSEEYFNRHWKLATGKSFDEFGKPFSYNFWWKK